MYLRNGFTTGSCAAAAAKASVWMLLNNEKKETVDIMTPAGMPYEARVLDISMDKDAVSCAVKKDGGDDPDITDGLLVCCRAVKGRLHDTKGLCRASLTGMGYKDEAIDGPTDRSIDEDFTEAITGTCNRPGFTIDIYSGPGIGIVTKPGLDRPVGEPAINSIPLKMIIRESGAVCQDMGYEGQISLIFHIPGGEEVARSTFNPRLGIEGGISIIGTSGIVKPMSKSALKDTIKVSLSQRRALGDEKAIICPGNYGLDFLKNSYGIDPESCIMCSNFIGDALDAAADMGFERIILAGHIGKLIKLTGGMYYTHSEAGDCRMELMCAACIRRGVSAETAGKILECVNTEAALSVMKEDVPDMFDDIMSDIVKNIDERIRDRIGGRALSGCIVYSSVYGELGNSL